MKRCIKCQRELADNAKFCTYCGTRQPDEAATPVTPTVAPEPVRAPKPQYDIDALLAEAVGKQEVLAEVQRLVSFYVASKREGRLRQRPEMDMLVLGNSGTGKTFVISLIHQMFLANGIVTHPRIKKVDASVLPWRAWQQRNSSAISATWSSTVRSPSAMPTKAMEKAGDI